MFKTTSTKLRNAAVKSQATAQRLLAAAAAVQAKASEQHELATAIEAKERVAELQLQAAAERSIYIQARDAYAKVIAERNVLEATLASCITKVEETRKISAVALDDFAKAKATVEAAQAELAE